MPPPDQNPSHWTPVKWHSEDAWASRSGELEAIVSSDRSRLIAFGPPDKNLLNAPRPLPVSTNANPAPNWGGHRFWLGPQKNWHWPPNPDWEHSAAATIAPAGEELILTHPQTDPSYPPITRSYSWTSDGRLRCQCKWEPSNRHYYGLHVLAVDPFPSIDLRLGKSDTAPLGFLQVTLETPLQTPRQTLRYQSLSPTKLRFENVSESGVKLAFPLQTISLQRNLRTLEMHHGEYTGKIHQEVDHAYRSQIWYRSASPFSEIEQISPYLNSNDNEWPSHTIYLGSVFK